MEKFILNITASSGEFYQGYCESLTLPTGDGVYGVQAGHNPVLVALHMGMLQFTVNGETRDVLVGDGIAEVTPTFVLLLVDSAELIAWARAHMANYKVPRYVLNFESFPVNASNKVVKRELQQLALARCQPATA